jgi:hypothetical protein
MKATLKDIVLGTPAGKRAVEEALKKSCEDQVKLLEESEKLMPIVLQPKQSNKSVYLRSEK